MNLYTIDNRKNWYIFRYIKKRAGVVKEGKIRSRLVNLQIVSHEYKKQMEYSVYFTLPIATSAPLGAWKCNFPPC